MVLTFHDEFNGTSLDTTKWNDCSVDSVGGAYMHPQDTFAYLPENAVVKNGSLHMEYKVEGALKFNNQGQLDSTGTKTALHSTAQIQTKGKFEQQYGWWEARMKFPRVQGPIPAFWLMPEYVDVDTDGIGHPTFIGEWIEGKEGTGAEIDIMEHVWSYGDKRASWVVHHGGYGNGHVSSGTFYYDVLSGQNIYDEWHTYALEWTENDELNFYMDGRYYGTYTGQGVPREMK